MDKEEARREVNEQLIGCFVGKYMPAKECKNAEELTIYDLRMFFNLFYVSDPRMDILNDYLERLLDEGFEMSVSYDGEPIMRVLFKD